MTLTSPDNTDWNQRPRHPEITRKEALKLGYSSDEYAAAEPLWESTAKDHANWGTPPAYRDPTPVQLAPLVEPFVDQGDQELKSRAESLADPEIDRVQELVEETVPDLLNQLEDEPVPVVLPGTSKASYTPESAVRKIRELESIIDRDQKDGISIHERVSPGLFYVALGVPVLEAGGFGFFVGRFLDVELFSPFEDFNAWVLTIVIAVATIAGQLVFTHLAGKAHNRGREASANSQRHEAEAAFGARTRWLVLSACTVSLAIIIGMIYRGEEALNGADLKAVLFMAGTAFVAGFVPPVLTFLAAALDGSSSSRERDALNAYVALDKENYDNDVSEIRGRLNEVNDTVLTVKEDIFPTILVEVRQVLTGATRLFDLLRLMIGGLVSASPDQPTYSIRWLASGELQVRVETNIPGGRAVDLTPLHARARRLEAIVKSKELLLNRLEELPPHPCDR